MGTKTFLLKVAVLAVILITVYAFALWNLSKDHIDNYYPKFTHQAGSMILGASRAQEGIVPSLIESRLDTFEKPMLNFAFKLAQSSYGPVYYNAIRKKLSKNKAGGIFLLSVSPGSLAIHERMNDVDDKSFDSFSILSRVEDFNSSPNYRYIRKFYGRSLYNGFLNNRKSSMFYIAHNDGWLELPLKTDQYEFEPQVLTDWKKKLLDTYSDHAFKFRPSEVRMEYLKKTITLLKQHGEVFLIRMPADPEVRKFESMIQEKFESIMWKLSSEMDVKYLSFLEQDGKYETYDGSHMSSAGAKSFTNDLCTEIENQLSSNIVRAGN